MSKHTPGPWSQSFGCDGSIEVYAKLPHAPSGSHIVVSIADVCRDANDPELDEMANARLIVAAPELLEALKNVTAHLVAAHSLLQDGGKKSVGSNKMFEIMLHDYEKSIDVGRAAIAKAEGKE